jgi:regulator of sirC expression with transglutaminase-like and TPR domain
VARRASKKLIVDYQTHRDEAPVPSLVAQVSEDPAIARARTAYLLGNDKLFAGDATAAVEAYREALSVYPGYVGGYRGLGLAYAQLGQTKQALDALKAYVAAVPTAKDAPLIKKRIAHLQGK